MRQPILALSEAITNKNPSVLATVIEIKGASPAKVGAQIILTSDGATAGTVGGGKLEAAVLKDAQSAFLDGVPKLTHYSLAEQGEDAVGTLCGGEVRVFIQPFLPPAQLIIVGGGHIGRPLKIMGEAAGYEVIVVDVDAGRATMPELEAIPVTEASYIILITTDHISDEAALRYAVTTPAALHRDDRQPCQVPHHPGAFESGWHHGRFTTACLCSDWSRPGRHIA